MERSFRKIIPILETKLNKIQDPILPHTPIPKYIVKRFHNSISLVGYWGVITEVLAIRNDLL